MILLLTNVLSRLYISLIAVVALAACGKPTPVVVFGPMAATDLYAEHERNEVAAEAKYKGNGVTVYGAIDDISTDLLGTPYVTFKAEDSLFGVQAMFTKGRDEARLAGFTKGQSLRITCEVSGKLGNVLLRNCK